MERNHIIILDHFGLHSMVTNIKLALLQLLEDRFEKKASNNNIAIAHRKWYEYLNEPNARRCNNGQTVS